MFKYNQALIYFFITYKILYFNLLLRFKSLMLLTSIKVVFLKSNGRQEWFYNC